MLAQAGAARPAHFLEELRAAIILANAVDGWLFGWAAFVLI